MCVRDDPGWMVKKRNANFHGNFPYVWTTGKCIWKALLFIPDHPLIGLVGSIHERGWAATL